MSPCQKCLENYWKYEFIDGWIKATCQICSNEVEFPSRDKTKVRKGTGVKSEWQPTNDPNIMKINGVDRHLSSFFKGKAKIWYENGHVDK